MVDAVIWQLLWNESFSTGWRAYCQRMSQGTTRKHTLLMCISQVQEQRIHSVHVRWLWTELLYYVSWLFILMVVFFVGFSSYSSWLRQIPNWLFLDTSHRLPHDHNCQVLASTSPRHAARLAAERRNKVQGAKQRIDDLVNLQTNKKPMARKVQMMKLKSKAIVR